MGPSSGQIRVKFNSHAQYVHFAFLMLVLLILPGCGQPTTGAPVYYESSMENRTRSPATFVSDAVLLTRVKSKFISDDMVDDDEIQIKVRHGVVYLDGWVADSYQRRMAQALAQSIDGVNRVVSRLRLTNPGTIFINPDPRTPVF
nr:BON domain-containing protein [uncultured Desulfobacter sp.]